MSNNIHDFESLPHLCRHLNATQIKTLRDRSHLTNVRALRPERDHAVWIEGSRTRGSLPQSHFGSSTATTRTFRPLEPVLISLNRSLNTVQNGSLREPGKGCAVERRRLRAAARATHSKVRRTMGRRRSMAGNVFGSFPLARRLRSLIKIPSGIRSRPRTKIPGKIRKNGMHILRMRPRVGRSRRTRRRRS
jgi:hypothetical protein